MSTVSMDCQIVHRCRSVWMKEFKELVEFEEFEEFKKHRRTKAIGLQEIEVRPFKRGAFGRPRRECRLLGLLQLLDLLQLLF